MCVLSPPTEDQLTVGSISIGEASALRISFCCLLGEFVFPFMGLKKQQRGKRVKKNRKFLMNNATIHLWKFE